MHYCRNKHHKRCVSSVLAVVVHVLGLSVWDFSGSTVTKYAFRSTGDSKMSLDTSVTVNTGVCVCPVH